MKKEKIYLLLLVGLLASCGHKKNSNSSVNESQIEPSSNLSSYSSASSIEVSSSDIVEETEKLLIYSIEMKVGYGDATLIKYKNFEMLIDGGDEGDAAQVKKALKTYVEDKELDYLIVTHPHTDHIGGIASRATFSTVTKIDNIIDTGYDYYKRKEFRENVISYYTENGCEYNKVADVMKNNPVITVDEDLSIHFLDNGYYDVADVYDNLNNSSVSLYIQYKNTIIFMAGDVESPAENNIVSRNAKFTTDDNIVIYKASHHGSSGSNNKNILEYLKPDYCFVSAAITSGHNKVAATTQHPYPDAIERIASYTKEIYWNGVNGSISITTDGINQPSFVGAGRTTNYAYYDPKSKENIISDIETEKNITYLKSDWYKNGVLNASWKNFD